MARIFITGSADGLGQLAAKELIAQGYQVVLHARNKSRAQDAVYEAPGGESIVTGDLSSIDETKQLALQVNALGKFDAVIHNAGIYGGLPEDIFAVNTLAPYVLTCLIEKPKRLIYLSSGLHKGGRFQVESFKQNGSSITYADSKLHVLMLAKAIARKCPGIHANAVNPGWVPTKMGGSGAPDDLEKGYQTQVWLASSHDDRAKVSGQYFYYKQATKSSPSADDVSLQEKFIRLCEEITGVSFECG